MLNQQELQQYERSLKTEQARLLKEIEDLSKPENFGDDIDAGDSKTDQTEAFADQLALGQTLKDRANEIEDALSRIANGTYGKCVECGGEISKEILDAAPESTLCANCKKGN